MQERKAWEWFQDNTVNKAKEENRVTIYYTDEYKKESADHDGVYEEKEKEISLNKLF